MYVKPFDFVVVRDEVDLMTTSPVPGTFTADCIVTVEVVCDRILAATLFKVTKVMSLLPKSVPVMVTVVPPLVGPSFGSTAVIVPTALLSMFQNECSYFFDM